MNHHNRIAVGIILAALTMPAATANAQNLLTNNPGFESGFNYFHGGGAYTNNGLNPGWVSSKSSSSGYTGVGNNQPASGKDGTFFSYAVSDTGELSSVETDAADRAAVLAGTDYDVSFKSALDFGSGTAQAGIVWYADNTSYTPLATALFGLGTPGKPMPTFTFTATAPTGATYAAFRIEVTGNGGFIFDSASIVTTPVVVPEAGTVSLLGAGLSVLGVVVVRRRK